MVSGSLTDSGKTTRKECKKNPRRSSLLTHPWHKGTIIRRLTRHARHKDYEDNCKWRDTVHIFLIIGPVRNKSECDFGPRIIWNNPHKNCHAYYHYAPIKIIIKCPKFSSLTPESETVKWPEITRSQKLLSSSKFSIFILQFRKKKMFKVQHRKFNGSLRVPRGSCCLLHCSGTASRLCLIASPTWCPHSRGP